MSERHQENIEMKFYERQKRKAKLLSLLAGITAVLVAVSSVFILFPNIREMKIVNVRDEIYALHKRIDSLAEKVEQIEAQSGNPPNPSHLLKLD